MIRVNCNRCINCTGKECKLYGDDPDKAVQCCAHDRFENYIQKHSRRKRNNKGGRKNGKQRKEQ